MKHYYKCFFSRSGLLLPPTHVTIISTSTELQISWTAPANWEDCITHYSIYTTGFSGAASVTNITDGGTSHTVDKPCSDVEVEVSGWSEGGEGERSKTKEVYTGVHINLIHVLFEGKFGRTNISLCYC